MEELLDLVEVAYFEGWKAGAETGKSDSPGWNASEDWADSDSRRRLNAYQPTIQADAGFCECEGETVKSVSKYGVICGKCDRKLRTA